MVARRPIVDVGGRLQLLPGSDTLNATAAVAENALQLAGFALPTDASMLWAYRPGFGWSSLGPGVLRDYFNAGFTSAVSITGAAGLITNSTAAPVATEGYTLFDQTLDTVAGQQIDVDISVPYMLISTTAGITLHGWANGVHIGTAVSRVTAGATSGNSIEPRFSFVAEGTSTRILIKIGVSNTAHTLQLFNRFGYASQPTMTVTRFGQVLASSVAPTPSPSAGPGIGLGGRKTVAIAGDSVVGQNSGSGSRTRLRDIGFMAWALTLCRQSVVFDSSWNFGVGGDNSGDMLARIGDVIAVNPDYVILIVGGNDVSQSITYEQTVANLTAIWDALFDAGICVITGLLYPRGPQTTYTPAWKAKAARINRFIMQAQFARKLFEVVDPRPRFTDYTNMNGLSIEHMTSDGVHPGTYGAFHIGVGIAEVLARLEPPRPADYLDVNDVYDPGANPQGNLLTNGLLFGVSGSVTGASGVVADGATVVVEGGITCVASKGTSEVNTPTQVLTVAGTAGATISQCYVTALAAAWPATGNLKSRCRVKVNNIVNWAGLQLLLRITSTNGDVTSAAIGEITTNTNVRSAQLPDGYWEGTMETPALAIPASVAEIRIVIGTGAYPGASISGELEVSCLEIIPV